ncbi:HD domain-containing phosphohydrolase [Oerskovia flava]|uniref:HD domain-containing phosphohydrolase n=1 Tax=Oerskovia flava TaxID=2986422 RepID=UPI0022407375|nr:HD domain-containing phosphohydrolase [Oerskovia sp. JB1-3-2]
MFRLLGLLGGLSVVTDLGTGAPLEEALKRCVVAARFARALGCHDDEVADVLYVSLLQHVGCTAYAHENARVWGDDVAAVRLSVVTRFDDPRDVLRTWVPGLAEATGRSTARVLATTITSGRAVDAAAPVATCEVAGTAARRLDLPATVVTGLEAVLCAWDGSGYPPWSGEQVPRRTRIVQVASTGVLFALRDGIGRALDEVARRGGSTLDPVLAEAFVGTGEGLLDGIADLDAYQAALDAEPDPVRLVGPDAVVEVAATFGDLVDLKSPWLHGHSSAVAHLAEEAVRRLGLHDDARSVRLAGHLHDLGRVGVSSRIWDKRTALTGSEEDQVRLHPYHGERLLSRVPELRDVARIAGAHHERCDGSGFHRGVTAAQLSMPARVLAAADAYQLLVEAGPRRPALTTAQAAARLTAQAAAGALDADAVRAVLEASGDRVRGRPVRTGGLTARQVEVLRLLGRGLTNREIARDLVISRRTAEHHVQDVYQCIGVSTRAAAALYAMRHGLVEESR